MALTTRLEHFFVGAAGKLLSAVEAHPSRSNQHEFNGVRALAELLDDPPNGGRKFATTYIAIDDDMEPIVTESFATWYDARAQHPTRSEFRLYYPSNEVMAQAVEGDYMLVARPSVEHVAAGRELVVVLAPSASTVAAQLQELFGLEASHRMDLELLPSGMDLNFAFRGLLEALGFEAVHVQNDYLEDMIARFGGSFPTTHEFSAYARSTAASDPGTPDPDAALLAWMDQEESLYRTYERHLLGDRLNEASGDVDRILELAMQTFQRRRSRAGHALENHVAHLFTLHGIEFDRQARTEGRKKPDFLFPGRDHYVDPSFPTSRLAMLGVKTTCKDRWRQVLTEADRIPIKHLLTLEAPISRSQLAEMAGRELLLVIPRDLHDLFPAGDADALLSLGDFIAIRRKAMATR